MGKKTSLLLLLIAIAAATAGLNGCGANIVLPPQTLDITATVSAGSLSHSTVLKLTVK
jgi:hypothetical protein